MSVPAVNADERAARWRAAWESLGGVRCICGAEKARRRCFCPGCYKTLPDATRRALWKKLGFGFEDAYHDALVWLRAQRLVGEVRMLRCNECGNEQADMGRNVACEECGARMPEGER